MDLREVRGVGVSRTPTVKGEAKEGVANRGSRAEHFTGDTRRR